MEIADWRKKIDELDQTLLELLNKRANYSLEIGKIKKAAGMAVYDPKREEQIFLRLAQLNNGPMSDQAVRRLFERIIDESRHIEKEMMKAKGKKS
ncbi:MAG: chorismate mutase [Deferribacteres bacterium]|nr:chorismate mutase [candidate division KSB1 bacterium]MCB9511998.1 chorismate mutase [Deferribacteres bacterium]